MKLRLRNENMSTCNVNCTAYVSFRLKELYTVDHLCYPTIVRADAAVRVDMVEDGE